MYAPEYVSIIGGCICILIQWQKTAYKYHKEYTNIMTFCTHVIKIKQTEKLKGTSNLTSE